MISMGSKPSKGKSRGGRRNSINNNTNNKNTNNVKSTIGGGGADRNAHGTTTILSGGGGVGGAAAFAIRQRSDSTDSTRGAFYQGSGRGTSVSRNLQNAERVAPTVREVVTGHHERRPRRLKQGSAHHRHEQNASMASLASYVMHSIDPLGDGTTAAAAMDDIHSPPPSPHPTPLREGSTGMPASPRTTEARKALFAGTIAGGGKNLLPPQSHQYHHRSTVKDATKTKDLDIPESRGSIYYFAQNSDNPNYGAMGLNDDDDDGPGGNVSRNTSLFGDHALLAVSAHRKENVHPPQDDPNIQSTTTQEDEIQMFSSMVHASEKPRSHDTHNNNNNRGHHHHHHSEAEGPSSADISDTSLFSSDSDADSYAALGTTTKDCVHRCLSMLDPTDWLMKDALLHEGTGACLCDQRSYTLAGLIRHFFYNPLSPEFSSLQQFDWAIVLGIVIGLYTAFWKWLIDGGVHVIWETVPQKLLEWGVFTGPDGAFPLPHFIWIVPAVFGGVLSYIFAVLPHQIPDQNEWINAVHSRGVQDYRTALPLFLLSTAGMWSGLGLGPELPLVLTGGMAGSWLALLTKQSMLQARVMNLTGASAAVAGFFGFPMAGALFVLEM